MELGKNSKYIGSALLFLVRYHGNKWAILRTTNHLTQQTKPCEWEQAQGIMGLQDLNKQMEIPE